VLREINGYHVASGEHLHGAAELAADGTTASGSRLYSGVFPDAGSNLARRLTSEVNEAQVFPEWGWAWPGNARILYNRASADPEGRPWSEGKKLVWWDHEAGLWTGLDVPQFEATKPPSYRPALDALGMDSVPGDGPFGAHPDGRGWLFVPYGMSDGPLPVHYEPIETVTTNTLHRQETDPLTRLVSSPDNPYPALDDPRFPFVATTYHLTEHFMHSRHDSWLAELQPAMFVEVDPVLAAERGVTDGGWVVVTSARGSIEARALVTERLAPMVVNGRRTHVVGLVHQFGYRGEVVGSSANDLTAVQRSADSDIHSAKSFVCDVRAGRLDGARLAEPLPTATEPALVEPLPETPWAAQPYGFQERA
jgi:formate dehydrogenase major subunit